MTVTLTGAAEGDLEEAFEYYERARAGLGGEFITEFRRAVDRILQNPTAWNPLDAAYRRCQLRRFPYGVIYRIEAAANEIVVVGVMDLRQHPDRWRRRTS